MIAVVYSGSRFADWRLADKGRVVTGFKTMGINPHHNDERFIVQLLNKTNSLVNYAEQIKRIYFFGAGSSSKEHKDRVANAFRTFFRFGKVFVEHDMQAAALATCGDSEGLVGVLGSGSNVGYFNGKKVEPNNYGLGYILADEGSANWIGRILLRSYLTETMPHDLRDKFLSRYPLDRRQILDKIYHQSNTALFLTSFTDFVLEHRHHKFIHRMIHDGFHLMFETYLLRFKREYPGLALNFVGSVAANYEDWLRQVAFQYGIEVGVVIREPIHNLLKYYLNKN
ncbi:hypothetical protein SAMN05216436_10260 [bacterium A37T11]|nr:hypothetical protein SAMN05216436_10260 [bacterium A37T11]